MEGSLKSLKNSLMEYFLTKQSTVVSIYLFGSYTRNDFVITKSDLDFLIILDLPPPSHHWDHPDFLQTRELIREHFLNQQHLFRKSLDPIDIVSLSLYEIKMMGQNKLKSAYGPLKLITFFAFDTVKNAKILWGEDVLSTINNIPDPKEFQESRFEWMKEYYYRKKTNEHVRQLVTLGSIIRHYAVLDGIRDIKKNVLHDWVKTRSGWITVETTEIFSKYFQFIGNSEVTIDLLDTKWQNETKAFNESILGKKIDIEKHSK